MNWHELETQGHPVVTYTNTILSIGGLVIGAITQNDIAWFIGIAAGIIAIVNGVQTFGNKREERKKTRLENEKIRLQNELLEYQLNNEKNKNNE